MVEGWTRRPGGAWLGRWQMDGWVGLMWAGRDLHLTVGGINFNGLEFASPSCGRRPAAARHFASGRPAPPVSGCAESLPALNWPALPFVAERKVKLRTRRKRLCVLLPPSYGDIIQIMRRFRTREIYMHPLMYATSLLA